LARYLATGEARVLGRRIEMTAVRAGGSEFPVELAITRIRWTDRRPFTGYLRDITERKQAIDERKRAEIQLAGEKRLLEMVRRAVRFRTFSLRYAVLSKRLPPNATAAFT